MTTTDAAAPRHFERRKSLRVLAALMTLALGACSNNLLGNSDNSLPPELASTPSQTAPAAVNPTKVTVATVIGAPDQIGKQLASEISDALQRQRVAVAKSGEKADYTVRGYVVAAKEKSGTKVSYIWDLFDGTGKRANRITGEEVVATAGENRDPWAGVGSNVIKTIGEKTASQIVGAIPKDGAAIASNSGGSSSAQMASNVSTAAVPTGSIAKPGSVMAVVPTVVGAPGDGSQSLASALQRELTRGGVQVGDVTSSGAGAYRVEGKVTLGQAQGSKQPIQIEWQVKDPQGKKLGTVSQKNEIPPGSLDGTWGQTADTAAAAAAQGIIKLLPGATKGT